MTSQPSTVPPPETYMYDGVVFPTHFDVRAIKKIKDFNFDQNDVIISTFPKTGTLWIGEIVWLALNDVNIDLARQEHNRERVPLIEKAFTDSEWNIDIAERMDPGSRLVVTHLRTGFIRNLREGINIPKVVCMIRNPKDTLVSFYHFTRANNRLGNYSGSFDDYFEIYKSKGLPFGDFFEHTVDWHSHPLKDTFLFVKYEDLKADPAKEIRRVFQYLGRKICEDEIQRVVEYTSFDKLKNCDSAKLTEKYDSSISPYMRKGTIGDWKNHMSDEQSEYVNKRKKEMLDDAGIKIWEDGVC